MFITSLNFRFNGVYESVSASSDQTLADVCNDNNIPYQGIRVTINGVPLRPEDFDRPLADVFADRIPGTPQPESVTLRSVKAMDNAA